MKAFFKKLFLWLVRPLVKQPLALPAPKTEEGKPSEFLVSESNGLMTVISRRFPFCVVITNERVDVLGHGMSASSVRAFGPEPDGFKHNIGLYFPKA
jgi:hypothetical protein